MADKVFCDPVHRHIVLEDKLRSLFLGLIDTPQVQRLRRIRQLGVSCYTYPGAEHTRFSHALGTFHVMTQALDTLSRSQPDLVIPEEVKIGARCAALLHDVGHGPFSHLTERVSKISHEGITRKVVLEDTHVTQVLKSFSSTMPDLVGSLLFDENREWHFVSDLLSSELDVDRMDYILRDAYCCGVPLGVYDYLRILHTLRVQDYLGDGLRHPIWLEKGQHSVEGMLYARFHMYWAVYYHPTTCGYEALYDAILKRSIEVRDKVDFLPGIRELLTGAADLAEYLFLDDSIMLAQIQLWRKCGDHVLADLCGRFLDRKGFKPFGPVDLDPGGVFHDACARKFLKQKGLPPAYYLLSRKMVAVAYNYYQPDPEAKKGIWLRIGERCEEISRAMAGVHALIEAPRRQCYYYIPREHEDGLTKILSPLLRK